MKVTLSDYEGHLNCCPILTIGAMGNISPIFSLRPCLWSVVGVHSHKPFPEVLEDVELSFQKADLTQHPTSDHLFTLSLTYGWMELDSDRIDAFKEPAFQAHGWDEQIIQLSGFSSCDIVQSVSSGRCHGAAGVPAVLWQTLFVRDCGAHKAHAFLLS